MVVVELQLLVCNALAIVCQLSDARALREMTHEDVSRLFVVKFSNRILV